MAKGTKVVVWIPARDCADIQAEGKDVAEWIRALVKRALEKRKESQAA